MEQKISPLAYIQLSERQKNEKYYSTCSRCGTKLHKCSVKKCKHPAIIQVLGEEICMYCCQKCEHNIFVDGGQECGFRLEASQ